MNNKEEIKYDFEIIEENNIKSELESRFENLYSHMLKYKFHRENQGNSWLSTIFVSVVQINKIIKNNKGVWKTIKDDNNYFEERYKESLKIATKDSFELKDFPSSLSSAGYEFNQNNVIDIDKIYNFLKKYSNNTNRSYILDKVIEYYNHFKNKIK